MAKTKDSGFYHLVLHLPRKIQIRVGALGRQVFPSGYYIYTGSARRGLSHRLSRHLRKQKKQHWHIDFLTAVAGVKVILVDESGLRTECQNHEAIMDLPGAEVVMAGFGSSDCRCRSHLAYFEKKPVIQDLLRFECSLVGIAQKHLPKILIPLSGRVRTSLKKTLKDPEEQRP